MAPHPRLRRTRDVVQRPEPALRVLAFAPGSEIEDWIVSEISRLDAFVQIERNVENVIAALIEDPPPRPAILVVDFDKMQGGAVMQLHAVRERGWCGVIIGVGMVPIPLRSSLGIERVVAIPATDGDLSKAIEGVGFTSQTVRIPVRRDTSAMGAFQVRATSARVVTKQSNDDR
jgi:hypothetical protein